MGALPYQNMSKVILCIVFCAALASTLPSTVDQVVPEDALADLEEESEVLPDCSIFLRSQTKKCLCTKPPTYRVKGKAFMAAESMVNKTITILSAGSLPIGIYRCEILGLLNYFLFILSLP